MSQTSTLHRGNLPNALRWLADQLEAGAETDRAGVSITLHALADQIHPPVEVCNAAGDAPNSSGKERCELPAGHTGRHYEGITTWPQEHPVGSEGNSA